MWYFVWLEAAQCCIISIFFLIWLTLKCLKWNPWQAKVWVLHFSQVSGSRNEKVKLFCHGGILWSDVTKYWEFKIAVLFSSSLNYAKKLREPQTGLKFPCDTWQRGFLPMEHVWGLLVTKSSPNVKAWAVWWGNRVTAPEGLNVINGPKCNNFLS